jgi:hypothetical protein
VDIETDWRATPVKLSTRPDGSLKFWTVSYRIIGTAFTKAERKAMQHLVTKWRELARQHREAREEHEGGDEYYLHEERALALEQCAAELAAELAPDHAGRVFIRAALPNKMES